ncbi:MAG: GntR family transcriptional regulator [Proteobacteria bacterium]|nr:GntR family transcriptional regulator [Pseudomonadota bacterium]
MDADRPHAAAPATPRYAPLYQQVREMLVARLAAGEWKPGEALPSELDLAARFNVAPGTLRKAIDALAAQNLVVRRQGKGTYVATHTEEHASSFRFLRIRSDTGATEYPGSRLVDVRRGRASADAARLLALKPGEAVLQLRRVLEFDGAPVVCDDITLPAALFKGLTRTRYEAYDGSMYGFFETEFGVRMLKAHERIKAVAADATAARLLRVAPGAPLLAVERVTTTFGDRPVELRRGLYATAHHHYSNDLG